MTSSADQQRDRLTAVSIVLRESLAVPTDTFITEDMPLLLTRLSQLPAVPESDASPQMRD